MPKHENYTLLNEDEVWSAEQWSALRSVHHCAEFYGVPANAKWLVDEIEQCGGAIHALADNGDRDGWTSVLFDGGLECVACVRERNREERTIYVWAAGEVPDLSDDL
jgi:hypothetical protein